MALTQRGNRRPTKGSIVPRGATGCRTKSPRLRAWQNSILRRSVRLGRTLAAPLRSVAERLAGRNLSTARRREFSENSIDLTAASPDAPTLPRRRRPPDLLLGQSWIRTKTRDPATNLYPEPPTGPGVREKTGKRHDRSHPFGRPRHHEGGYRPLADRCCARPRPPPALDFADWCERQKPADIDSVILDWLWSQVPARTRVLS